MTESTTTENLQDEDVEAAYTLCHSLGTSEEFLDTLKPNDVCWGENYDWSKRYNDVSRNVTPKYIVSTLYNICTCMIGKFSHYEFFPPFNFIIQT